MDNYIFYLCEVNTNSVRTFCANKNLSYVLFNMSSSSNNVEIAIDYLNRYVTLAKVKINDKTFSGNEIYIPTKLPNLVEVQKHVPWKSQLFNNLQQNL